MRTIEGTEFIIVGDYEEFKDPTCLIYVCGKNRTRAEEVLNRMLTNPNEQDKKLLKKATNIRIEEVKSDDCWWNHGCD